MLLSPSGPNNVGGRTRMIKLRAACNQCNVAKVKCSGEKTGCERCLNCDLQCVYMESRVGKVPGVRARKKSVHHQLGLPRLDDQGRHFVVAHAQQSTSSGDSSGSTMMDEVEDSNDNDSIMQWTTESNRRGVDLDNPYTLTENQMMDSVALNSTNSTNSEISEMVIPGIDFDIDDLLRYPLEPDKSPAATPVPDDQDGRRRAELDSQCVLVCCQIASELESYMVADIKSLRIVLGIVRKGVERLSDAVALQQGSRNFRTMALFGVILYQLIQLLESGCACFLDTNGNRKDSFTAQIQGMLPGLSLGGLATPEEQSSWRSHIVLKEIQQTSEVLQRVKKLMTVGEKGAEAGPSNPEERERCFIDMESRLKVLSDKVASRK